jgi:hypothetical protein
MLSRGRSNTIAFIGVIITLVVAGVVLSPIDRCNRTASSTGTILNIVVVVAIVISLPKVPGLRWSES